MTNPPAGASEGPAPHSPPGPPTRTSSTRTSSTARTLVIMVSVVLGIALLGLAALFVYTRFFTLTGADVGDCLAGDIDEPYSIAITDCGTPEASYQVVGRVEDTTMAEFESKTGQEACAAFERAEYLYFEGFGDDATASGAILCLSTAS